MAISIAVSASSIVAGIRSRMSESAAVPCTNERAEVAPHRAGNEAPVLRPERLVETQRGDRPLAVDLVRLRADQDVDRIADRVDADENEHGHREQHNDALKTAANDENEHPDFTLAASRARGATALSAMARSGMPG